jgi:glycosyltransferase involved in cell wall biosynthesis
MKVIVVSQYLNRFSGGAERYIHEVCTRLERDHGFLLKYISIDTCSESSISRPGCRLFSSGFHIKWYAELTRIFKKQKPDIIYIHYTVPGISDVAFFVAKKMNIPCAVMYHSDITGLGWLKIILGHVHFFMSGKRILNNSNIIFVSSQTYVQNSIFLKSIKRSYIEAPPGINSVLETDQTKNKQEIYLPKKPYILFVGKPELREKGFHLLMRAWQIIRQKGNMIDLIVAGDFDSNAWSKRKLETGLSFIGLVTSRKKLFSLYGAATITVLPSLTSESFGMVIVEALSAGCPVIASNIGGIPELIHEGKNGYLFDPGDVDALVEVIQKGLENNKILRENINTSGKKMLEKYDWDLTAGVVADSFIACPYYG